MIYKKDYMSISQIAFYTMLKKSKGGNKLGKLAYIILTLT